MAIFTNSDDLNLNIITQSAQIEANSQREVLTFVLRFAKVPEGEAAAWFAQKYPSGVPDFAPDLAAPDFWAALKNPLLRDDGIAAAQVICLTQSILKTVIETGGNITQGQRRKLKNVRREIEKRVDSETEAGLDFWRKNSVLFSEEENALIPAEEWNVPAPPTLYKNLLRVSLLLLDALESLLNGDYRNLQICSECKSIYQPLQYKMHSQRFCSRRCRARHGERRRFQSQKVFLPLKKARNKEIMV